MEKLPHSGGTALRDRDLDTYLSITGLITAGRDGNDGGVRLLTMEVLIYLFPNTSAL